MTEPSLEEGNIIVKPTHYTRHKIEPVTFVMENNLPFHMLPVG